MISNWQWVSLLLLRSDLNAQVGNEIYLKEFNINDFIHAIL